MINLLEKYKSCIPRQGDTLKYLGIEEGIIENVDGSICHYKKLNGEYSLFIWVFKEGLNNLFDWPNKPSPMDSLSGFTIL